MKGDPRAGWLALPLVLLVASCVPAKQPTTPATGPAPTQSEEVRELMWEMARSTETIHMILQASTWPTQSDQQTIVMALVDIEKRSVELEKLTDHGGHPIFDDKLERFQRDIRGARMAAEMSPPNLFLAGKLVGVCNGCHVVGFAKKSQTPVVHKGELPDVGRALLSERMARHGDQMQELTWAVLFMVDQDVAEIAKEITDEARIARPIPGFPEDLNAQFPKEFFDLQDQLRVRAGALLAAAESGEDGSVAKAFGGMLETCVQCHARYLEPHEGLEN